MAALNLKTKHVLNKSKFCSKLREDSGWLYLEAFEPLYDSLILLSPVVRLFHQRPYVIVHGEVLSVPSITRDFVVNAEKYLTEYNSFM